ncbi:hypothetical protein [Blautia pseudococcoides]|nr:hypothetical protein [Blautia pseudococcoides]
MSWNNRCAIMFSQFLIRFIDLLVFPSTVMSNCSLAVIRAV